MKPCVQHLGNGRDTQCRSLPPLSPPTGRTGAVGTVPCACPARHKGALLRNSDRTCHSLSSICLAFLSPNETLSHVAWRNRRLGTPFLSHKGRSFEPSCSDSTRRNTGSC